MNSRTDFTYTLAALRFYAAHLGGRQIPPAAVEVVAADDGCPPPTESAVEAIAIRLSAEDLEIPRYGWIIDEDHDEPGGEHCEKGRRGPRELRPDIEERLLAGEGHAFRMYDDDRNLMYCGRLFSYGDQYTGFEPLSDFGAPNVGATEIHYIGRDGQWERL